MCFFMHSRQVIWGTHMGAQTHMGGAVRDRETERERETESVRDKRQTEFKTNRHTHTQ